jgi:hypothetical protein
MDVGDWLRGLGLGRYEAAFRDNEIDERVLPSLTQEDLKEIGVVPVGHRRILLEAVAALRTDATGNAPSTDRANTSNALDLPPEDRAERRQVTVMFSDLVGSSTPWCETPPMALCCASRDGHSTLVSPKPSVHIVGHSRPVLLV